MGQSSTTLNPAAVSGGDAYLVYDIAVAWATTTLYSVGQVRTANGNAYRCIGGGTSAGSGTGPSGTTLGAPITDNTVTWVYIGSKVVIAESLIVDVNGNVLGSAASPFIVQMSDGTSAFTAAKESGGNLATLVARTPALGQALAAGATPVVLPVAQDMMASSGMIGGWTAFYKATNMAAGGELIKSGSGVLGSGQAINGTGSTAFLQAHDLAAATGLSSSTILVAPLSGAGAGAGGTLTLPQGGLKFVNGLVFAWSTTQFTYTAVGSNTGGVQAGYK